MPSNETSVAQMWAQLGEEGLSPEGLRFSLALNTFPSVTAIIADTSGNAVRKPVSEDVISRIGDYQSRRLAGRTDPDFRASASDGRGGAIEYEGFTASPILELTKVNTADKIATVGQAAFLDALDLSIYDGEVSAARPEAAFLKPVPAATDGDLPGILQQVTDALVANYDGSLEMQTQEIAKRRLSIQHEINESGPLELWEEILSASDVTFLRWEESFAEAPDWGGVLTEKVKEILMASSPGFWNKVRTLMSAFQMYYVPSFDNNGRFARMDLKVGDPTDTIKASVAGLSVSDGSKNILQPGGVVMVTNSSMKSAGGNRPESLPDLQEERVVGFHPNPLRTGYIHQAEPPFWLLDQGYIAVPNPEASAEASVGDFESSTVNLSLAERKKTIAEAETFKDKVLSASQTILEEYCEIMFRDIRLAHSTAGLTLPLDFSMNDKMGQRVTVELQGGGGGAFTAFVTGVDHGVDLIQGKQLKTYTKVQLSHCDFSGG